ncbi:MAG: amino acid ABC transporter substrate-binding protein [Rhodoplanes sp.]
MPLFPHRAVLRIVFAAIALFTTVAIASGQPSDSRLKRIGDAKTVKIAYRSDSKPFSFLTEQREPAGYTIDLCKLIVKSLEQQVNSPLGIAWVPVTTRDRFEAVANGSADMECGSSTVTLGRMKEVDFSNYIFVENTALAVTAASGIHALADLGGRKIAVIAGTTNEKALARALERRHLTATVIRVGSRVEGLAALESGRVDAFASDRYLLGGMKTDTALTLLPEDISTEPYAVALPRGDWAFRLAVNTALAQIFRSGEILNIFTKWFGGVAQRPNLLIGAVYLLGSLAD